MPTNRGGSLSGGPMDPGGRARALSTGIAVLCLLAAVGWTVAAVAPGGPDSGVRVVGAIVAIAVAIASAVLWATRRCTSARSLLGFVVIADLATLLAALVPADPRVGLAATTTLVLLGTFTAGYSVRAVVYVQAFAAAVIIVATVAVGVSQSAASVPDLAVFAVEAAVAAVVLPLILHHGFAVAGNRHLTQRGEPMRDPLTEVLTRHGLYSAASTGLTALNRKDYLVVVRVHLDQFHDIAVGDGHERGEQVLKRVADRLAQGVRGGDFVARTGDAEFSALAGVTHEGVEIFANRFRELVFDVSDPVPVSASVGVAFTPTPIDSADVQTPIDDLLHRAGVAMQSAQDAGGDRVEIDWSAVPPVVAGGPDA
ncbi:diguanylate cyclase domain-containing protein [Williamsia sp. M5A3_1d]